MYIYIYIQFRYEPGKRLESHPPNRVFGAMLQVIGHIRGPDHPATASLSYLLASASFGRPLQRNLHWRYWMFQLKKQIINSHQLISK